MIGVRDFSDTQTGVLVVSVLLGFIAIYRSNKSKAASLPPGPPKLPLIGSLLHLPSSRAWLTYEKWAKEYDSDILHLSAAGQSIIVLNTTEVVNDLLEKRASIYSSRLQMPMLHGLIGWKFSFSFGPYDDIWKAQRRIFTQAINPSDAERFYVHQTSAARELVRHLHKTTDALHDFHNWAAVMIMDLAYGIKSQEAGPYISTAIAALQSMAIAGTPGAFLVDTLPFLKYIPEWVPGAGFKRKARHWSSLREAMTEDPFKAAKQKIEAGEHTTSLTSFALERIDQGQDIAFQEEVIKGAAVTCYGGGSDTIVAALTAFLLQMLLQPDIQKRAQHELDQVLGKGDLPTFSDEPDLPYITALVKETLRHNPITPLAIPHLLTEDDTYNGYYLPKGSIVIGNAWAILHDEKEYAHPLQFDPARFLRADGSLDPDVKDPATAAFGFGRRICPGRHIAISALWIAVASILAMYDITKEVDAAGNVVEPSGEWVGGPTLFNHPLPFKCNFVPRSKAAEAALQALEDGGEDVSAR